MTMHATPDPVTRQAELDLAAVALELDVAETARARQLAALPTDPSDEVGVLHRESVERVLTEIRAAQQRLADGTYGTCAGCALPIAAGRLELRPWATTCTSCAAR